MTVDVLVIDDDPRMIELLIDQINTHFSGVRLVSALSGYGAIEILQNKTDFELIISDYNMPDGSGIDVLNYLVNAQRTTFFVLYTSQLDPVLPKTVGDFFLGVVEKMNFEKLNLIMAKLFVK